MAQRIPVPCASALCSVPRSWETWPQALHELQQMPSEVIAPHFRCPVNLPPATHHTHTHTHARPFNGPLSGTTQVSRYQKGKTNLDFTEARETVSGSGIRWAICKSALPSRQITMPVPHHSVFYRPDALPAAQPTVSKHRRNYTQLHLQLLLLRTNET